MGLWDTVSKVGEVAWAPYGVTKKAFETGRGLLSRWKGDEGPDLGAIPQIDPSLAGPTEEQQAYRDMLRQQMLQTAQQPGPQQVQMGDVQLPTLGAAPTVEAAQIAGPDPAMAHERGELMQMLRARAEGTAPSAAEKQLQMSQEANLRALQAAAAGGRGAQIGASLQAQQGQLAQANQQAAAQAALLRAQEQERAQGQLMQQLTSQQQMAQQRAMAQAGLTQEAGLAGARLGQERALAEYRTGSEMGMQQQRLGMQAGMFNVEQQQAAQRHKENLMQQYLAQGMSSAEADRRAAIEVQGMVGQQAMQLYGLEQQRRGEQTRQDLAGLRAGMEGIGTFYGGGAGRAAGGAAADKITNEPGT